MISRPSHPDRRSAIETGTVNAVFDEGILNWGQIALDHGFRFLPVDGEVMTKLEAMGHRRAQLSEPRFSGVSKPIPTADFSGWPMVVHANMQDDVAYALCEAIESRKDAIPSDNFKPLDMVQLCTDGEETPFDVPFHPGAERFYRERGYLK